MGSPFLLGTDEGFEGQLYAENQWDTVVVNSFKLPGICRVQAFPNQAVDTQKANGGDSATIILRGYTPGPIEIEVTMWTRPQWERFCQMIAWMWRRPNKPGVFDLLPAPAATTRKGDTKAAAAAAAAAQAAQVEKENAARVAGAALMIEAKMSVYHPALAALGISDIAIIGVSVPQPGPQPQTIVVKLKAVEYVGDPKTAAPVAPVAPAGRVVKGSKVLPATPTNSAIPPSNAPVLPSKTDGGPGE